jgi:hypothetical protein
MDLINEYEDLIDDVALVAVPDDILFTDELLSSVIEISVPEFARKININHDEELPSLEELPKEVEVEVEVETEVETVAYNSESLEQIMGDIESAVNFDSFDDSMYALNNPEFLMNRIQSAFDVFRGKVGRNMTYSEMRYMMG